MEVSIQIPRKHWYPEKPVTIGEHLRKMRMDRGLFQEDVAVLIGVTTDCITNWENERSIPQIQFMPGIISFLGYLPLEIDTSTIGGRIKEYRIRNGLSYKRMGALIGVDGSTVATWEKDRRVSNQKVLDLIEAGALR